MANPCEDLEDLTATSETTEEVVAALCIDTVDNAETYTPIVNTSYEDVVACTEALDLSHYYDLVDSVATALDFTNTFLRAVTEILDTFRASDEAVSGFTIVLTDTVALTETYEPHLDLGMSDAVALTETVAHTALANQAVTDVVALLDTLVGGMEDNLVDTVALAETLTPETFVTTSLTDTIDIAPTVETIQRTAQTLEDSVATSGELLSVSVLVQSLEDFADISSYVWYQDTTLLAWQMNTETTALNWHTNYGFESIAQYNDKVFGVSEDGIFLLTGDTDAGTLIPASVKSGFMDFDKPQVKRMEGVYFGYHGGQIQVTVDVYGHGGGSNTYTMPAKTVAAPGSNRVILGKGLASRYWRVKVSNLDGGYFDVDNIEFDVAASKQRRI